MPTNEQRRATAKRKLERQLERRAAKERKRRIYTIVGSVVGAIVVIGAVVATVVITNKDSGSQTASAATTTPTTPAPETPGRRRPAARVRRAGQPGRQLPVPGVGGEGEQAEQPAPHRQGADRPGADQRQHGDQPGQHRPDARQRQVAVHGQQLRQPGPAGLLQRHAVPPADHLRGRSSVLQCGDPTGQGTGGPGYQFDNEYPTNQFQPDDPKLGAAGGVSARHAGDGQRRAGHQRQPVLPGVQGFAAAAELHGVRHHRRDRPGHAGQDRRGRGRRRRAGRQACDWTSR